MERRIGNQTRLLMIMAAALVSGLVTVPAARAENNEEAAALKTKQAAELLDAGNPGEALVLFRQAYALVPKPTYRYNIAVALQALQQDTQAFEEFGLFLSEARYYETPNDRIADAEKQRQDLSSKFAFIDLTVNKDGAQILVDDFPRGKSPLRSPVPVLPGVHAVRIEKAGFVAAAQSMTLAAGVTQSVIVSLASQPIACPLPAASPPAATPAALSLKKGPEANDQPHGHRKLFWGAVVTGIVAAAATGVLVSQTR
jgi:hypothetical protein